MVIKFYNTPFFTHPFYKFARLVSSPVVKAKFDPIILNEDKIVNKGPVGYAPNHSKTMDPFAVTYAIPRPIHFGAIERFFTGKDSIFNNSKNPILCQITVFLTNAIGSVPLIRKDMDVDTITKSNTESLKLFKDYLEKEYAIGLFVEGTTTKPEGTILLEAKPGLFHLISEKGGLIQPISLTWTPKEIKISNRVIINIRDPFSMDGKSIEEAKELWRHSVMEGLLENDELIKQKTLTLKK